MRIAHISDLHFGKGSDFNEVIFEKAASILNGLKPKSDFIFISGDITIDGLLSEYEMAMEKLKKIEGNMAIVPGNHDERNLGYKLFPEFFSEPSFVREYDDILLVALASSEPDKDEGHLGRRRHLMIEEAIQKKKMSIIGFHHHLIPVPNSGRERNVIEDAGETLDIILRNEVPLVLMGHRHVNHVVKIHKTLLVNAGTFSCNRTRAHFGNSFNIIDIDGDDIFVTVVDICNEKQKKMVHFNQKKDFCMNRYYE